MFNCATARHQIGSTTFKWEKIPQSRVLWNLPPYLIVIFWCLMFHCATARHQIGSTTVKWRKKSTAKTSWILWNLPHYLIVLFCCLTFNRPIVDTHPEAQYSNKNYEHTVQNVSIQFLTIFFCIHEDYLNVQMIWPQSSDSKTHVKKVNRTFRTDLSYKMLWEFFWATM